MAEGSKRNTEKIDKEELTQYLKEQWNPYEEIKMIQKYSGGYSNLTYKITTNFNEYVLRRPPVGANIKTAHDMEREFTVLSKLRGHYDKAPRAVHYCSDESTIGTPFFIMEKVDGLILRPGVTKPETLSEDLMKSLSERTVKNLAKLHRVSLRRSGLDQMGKPEGYVKRQVEGWIKRYHHSMTDDLKGASDIEDWLEKNMPIEDMAAFIHNDYKYDNLVLDPEDYSIRAVLDWEMATVGHPHMDLGTTLAYWSEKNDDPALTPFNLTSLPGNLTRQEVLELYQKEMYEEVKNPVFFYVFGLYKVAVIGQQIYKRFKEGKTQDPRFGALIHVIRACIHTATVALDKNRISWT